VLDAVGFGPEAELIYEAMIGARPLSADDLSAATGLAAETVSGALAALEKSGLIGRAVGTPARYIAADPGLALDVLLLQREEEIKRARLRAGQLAQRFHQAAVPGDPTRLVEIITGRHAVQQRSRQLQRSARRDLRGFDKPPYAGDPVSVAEVKGDLAVVGRGGRARAIYDRSAVELPGRLANLEQGVAAGEEARVLAEVPTKLVLVDDTAAMIPLASPQGGVESSLVIHPSALLDALGALFETLWRIALPLELAAADAELIDHPDPGERHILALLTAGLPDHAISRQLGVSDRTYQRRIHNLMERLNVQTRFQLARQATRRGWLTDP
jgi:DNA-binding CsgD family transcriptional regulator